MFFTVGQSEDGGTCVAVHSFELDKSNETSFFKIYFSIKKSFWSLYVILVFAFSGKKVEYAREYETENKKYL